MASVYQRLRDLCEAQLEISNVKKEIQKPKNRENVSIGMLKSSPIKRSGFKK